MRPKSSVLRYAFRAAGAKLKSEEKKVTVRTLADEMGADFRAVQRLLYRDRDLASEIGVELEHTLHGIGEYADAIVNIPSHQRPTHQRIATILGIDRSTVSRFLREHPELRALHPRFDKLRHRPRAAEKEAPKESPRTKVIAEEIVQEPPRTEVIAEEVVQEPPSTEARRWKDLHVSVWNEQSVRYTGKGVTREQYLDLWKKGLLKHQRENQPRPEHLPTPEEVSNMT